MHKHEIPTSGKNEFELQQEKFKAAKKSTLISVAVNTLLSIWQIIVGIFSHSSGLIADGIHTLSDLIADFVVLIANKKSHKKPDADHPYGHFRYENGASLILGIILLIVGVGMGWSAVEKMINPDLIPEVHTIALVAALTALVAKEGLFRYMLHVANKVNSSMLVANAWHARSDAASSLVVAIGIIGSLCGIRILDPIAALIVGTFVFRMGFKFTYQSMQDLMDKGADEETLEQMSDVLRGISGVKGFHDLKTRKSGDFFLVDVHLELDGQMTILEGHDIAVNVRKQLMKNPQILDVMTHLDPYDKDCLH
ncbi:cation diffusion facilitator family transporter [Providencia sp. wls1943]|jgi:cation diffusion facilitator family transporter|uniref:Cation diffusion facilitator family transporter n=1 Tax=Providencia zhijiangensis TaxID=3053982 RepID=A0ABZ0MYL8_9GAMM|nr:MULTISPECIES: cation diffusion facilitator family transporter [Providencia]MTC73752.1 cation diffusion facilitator family transporter [Providencia sp. wls1919]MTB66353.1 cation diffusion facilitator family transporter [Providencia sp. wls1943]MTC69962.1 cation diffusion facilitator family transporter [Providencia sp. wls1914]QLR03843.1 cation transporter [Providencia rettgeri]WPA91212.1 cation diffusion facilitator family transporter [Providencia sp. D4759]